jgi:hypothetical protein
MGRSERKNCSRCARICPVVWVSFSSITTFFYILREKKLLVDMVTARIIVPM